MRPCYGRAQIRVQRFWRPLGKPHDVTLYKSSETYPVFDKGGHTTLPMSITRERKGRGIKVSLTAGSASLKEPTCRKKRSASASKLLFAQPDLTSVLGVILAASIRAYASCPLPTSKSELRD